MRILVACVTLIVLCQAAEAGLEIQIDKTNQKMTVLVDGEQRHVWRVSTGRIGYRTPNGTFRPQWLARRWYSRKYDWSPMPYSIFFKDGYAIHGTEYVSRLGRPASHGCIRLHTRNAAALFALVQQHGKENTQIVVTGSSPEPQIASRPARRQSLYASGARRTFHATYGWPWAWRGPFARFD